MSCSQQCRTIAGGRRRACQCCEGEGDRGQRAGGREGDGTLLLRMTVAVWQCLVVELGRGQWTRDEVLQRVACGGKVKKCGGGLTYRQ